MERPRSGNSWSSFARVEQSQQVGSEGAVFGVLKPNQCASNSSALGGQFPSPNYRRTCARAVPDENVGMNWIGKKVKHTRGLYGLI